MLSIATLLLHAAVFSGLDWSWPQAESAPAPAATMQLRVLDAALPSAKAGAKSDAPLREAPMAKVPRATAVPVAAPAFTPVVAHMAVSPAVSSSIDEAAPAIQVALDTAPAEPTPLATAERTAPPKATVDPAAADETVQRYRTKMPPPILLRYDLQRGILHGSGDLTWRPQGNRYEIKLEGKVGNLAVLTQVSTGEFDADGVAPQRFVDQRFRRPTAAANFQRSAGKITFSGPSNEFELRPGAQDRLSWMVQLAAVVAAEPHLRAPGSKIAMYVVGAQGDASIWVFRCIGPDSVAVGSGTVDAIKFVREPREPYDTNVQVWLDPQRHDLPVRATQKSGSNDDAFELRLREMVSLN